MPSPIIPILLSASARYAPRLAQLARRSPSIAKRYLTSLGIAEGISDGIELYNSREETIPDKLSDVLEAKKYRWETMPVSTAVAPALNAGKYVTKYIPKLGNGALKRVVDETTNIVSDQIDPRMLGIIKAEVELMDDDTTSGDRYKYFYDDDKLMKYPISEDEYQTRKFTDKAGILGQLSNKINFGEL